MSLTVAEQTALQVLINKRKPISGIYFRSVERRFMDPSQLLSGRGTELYGNRFAPIGMRGVFLADSDPGASMEVLARKKRLGGAPQITLDKYPRVIFAVDVELERVVSLVRKPRNSALAAIRHACLDDDLSYSQDVGRFLAKSGIQGLLYKSLVGPGVNLLVFLENCGSGQLKVRKLDETMETLKQIVSSLPPNSRFFALTRGPAFLICGHLRKSAADSVAASPRCAPMRDQRQKAVGFGLKITHLPSYPITQSSWLRFVFNFPTIYAAFPEIPVP